jgi:serine/threonine protein kinase
MNIGDIIDNKYLILEEIGQGGMGKVFKVEMSETHFALKVCMETDDESIKRFNREVRLMASIKHENVIEILDKNIEGENPYFVMPLCKFSIDDRLDILQANPEFAIDVLLNVCKGINAIHISGIIHRDIKPKNILISQDDQIKISDLGLGKFSTRDSSIITSSNIYMGTQGFIPPEFFRHGGTKNADVRSDIYQLGKTIYNIFTNSNPSLIQKDILPGGLLFIIQKCINDNPDARYQSVNEVANSLSSYLKSLSPQENPSSAFENLINIAIANSKLKLFDKDNVEEIIKIVFSFRDDTEFFFNKFNEIPLNVLDVVASNLNELCKELIDIYCTTVTRHFQEDRINFSDAELVASAMLHIYNGSADIEIKMRSMKMTLFAAVYCNRYYAMAIFDEMLLNIKNDQDAFVVSEMLKENIADYEQVASRIPTSQLHPIIQILQKEIQIKEEEERMNRNDKPVEW